MSSIADQLSEVVLVVNALVENLEREEYQQEQDFFRSERLAIEIEFETRLAELRGILVAHSKTELQTQPTPPAQQKSPNQKPLRPHAAPSPQRGTLAQNAAPPSQSQQQQPSIAVASAAPPVSQLVQVASPAKTAVPSAAQPTPPPRPARSAATPSAPAAVAAIPPSTPVSAAQVAAAVAASTGVAPLGSAPSSAQSAAVASTAASSVSLPSTLSVQFGTDGSSMRLSLEALSSAFPGLDARSHRDGVLHVPNVELRTAKLILSAGANRKTQRAAAITRAENERVRASQGNGFRVVLSEENRTEELIPDSALPSVVDACNALRIPWLFCLVSSRLFAARPGSDLAWLHNLVATSVLNSLGVGDLLALQEELLHVNANAVHVAMSAEMRGVALSGGCASPESLKAVLNMVWFLRVSREFAASYKMHLKKRNALLGPQAAATTAPPAEGSAAVPDVSYLEAASPPSPAAATASAEGALATPKRPAAPSILWVRIYTELLFAHHLLQLGSAPPPSAGGGMHLADEALQLWRAAGALPSVLLVDLSLLGRATGPSRVALHFLQLLIKECRALVGLRLADVPSLDAQAFVVLLATGTNLRQVSLSNVNPFISHQALESLQLGQYFPNVRVQIEGDASA